jgi:hypothetical protein
VVLSSRCGPIGAQSATSAAASNGPPRKEKAMAGLGGIRRVVTTHDEDGKAVILYDAPTPY